MTLKKGFFRSLPELSKLHIMIPVSLSGLTGYFLYKPVFSLELGLVTAGILLMAVSASIINQIQEIDIDRKMNRTKERPLPAGNISVRTAIFVAIAVLLAGCCLFLYSGSIPALLLSIFTLIWYNGIYTYLKRLTPFAVIPGSLTGAMPPLIGWVAAGGDPFSLSIILVQFFFFMGQIPHFWLLMIKYGDEYRNAGLPSLTSVLNRSRISALIIAFVFASATSAILIGLSGTVHSTSISKLLFGMSAVVGITFLRFNQESMSEKYSLVLNIYYLMVMVMLVSDRLIS